jgi:glycosyltransferase involved in cell wall biosynthesis
MSKSEECTPKHIALFVRSFEGSGGAERVFLNLAYGLVAQGHRVDLVMARQKGLFLDQIPPEVRIVDLKVRSARQSWWILFRLGKDAFFWARMLFARKPHYVLGTLSNLANYLKREQPDVMISCHDYPNVVAVMARDLARVGCRVILTAHSTLSHEMASSKKRKVKAQAEVDRRFYPRAEAIVTVSQGVADDLASILDLPLKSFTTIYNPVVSERLEQQATEPLTHPWFSGDGPPVVLTVGGFKPAKDHATLLKAFALVRKKRPVRLLILGEGKLRQSLTRQAGELGISEDLEMPGFVDNPYQYLARSSLFVLSSVFEGLPMVLIEALACGCPVVSTDCPSGPSEILDHGRYGRLVPMCDEKTLAEAINQALDASQDKASLVARGQVFSLEKATEKYLELIDAISDES